MLKTIRNLDLQLLRLFITIVESGGFSAAQDKLGMAPSTISTQMAKLEARLGFRLCDRGKSGFRLTPKGERVLQSTRRLLQALDVFTRDTQHVSGTLLGDLRIGLSERLAPEVIESIAAAVGRFREHGPDVMIEILASSPDELERKLLKGELHLSVGYFSGHQVGLNYVPLFVETQSLYCGTAHPLYAKKALTIDDAKRASNVARLYKSNAVESTLRNERPTAFSENTEADTIFILSGAHIGFLPDHIAARWVMSGKMHKVLGGKLSHSAQFQLATPKNCNDNEVLNTFQQILIGEFEELTDRNKQ